MGGRDLGSDSGLSLRHHREEKADGVDSILVSASFLGWPFAIFKLIVAFITGIVGGSIVDFVERNQKIEKEPPENNRSVSGFWPKIKEAVNFSLFELLGMIYGWIIFGVIVAALITTFIPPGYLSNIAWISGIGGLFLMLLIALPMYVCATASVPIAVLLGKLLGRRRRGGDSLDFGSGTQREDGSATDRDNRPRADRR